MSSDFTDALERDLFSPDSWAYRAQTILLFGGVCAFGVALGVRWAAIETINHFISTQGPLQANQTIAPLASSYNAAMRTALAVALVTLLGGAGLWAVGGDDDET